MSALRISLAAARRDLADLSGECFHLAGALRRVAIRLGDDYVDDADERESAERALSELAPLAVRLADVVADLRRCKGGER